MQQLPKDEVVHVKKIEPITLDKVYCQEIFVKLCIIDSSQRRQEDEDEYRYPV